MIELTPEEAEKMPVKRNVFVLTDYSKDGIDGDVVGVFDHPDISDDELRHYFGDNFERTNFRDIRDSGIEWIMDIRTSDNEISRLVLHEYMINEI